MCAFSEIVCRRRLCIVFSRRIYYNENGQPTNCVLHGSCNLCCHIHLRCLCPTRIFPEGKKGRTVQHVFGTLYRWPPRGHSLSILAHLRAIEGSHTDPPIGRDSQLATRLVCDTHLRIHHRWCLHLGWLVGACHVKIPPHAC